MGHVSASKSAGVGPVPCGAAPRAEIPNLVQARQKGCGLWDICQLLWPWISSWSGKRLMGKPHLCLFQGKVSIFRISHVCNTDQRNMNMVCVSLLGTGVSVPGGCALPHSFCFGLAQTVSRDSVTARVPCACWRLLKGPLALHHRWGKSGQLGIRTGGNILLLRKVKNSKV